MIKIILAVRTGWEGQRACGACGVGGAVARSGASPWRSGSNGRGSWEARNTSADAFPEPEHASSWETTLLSSFQPNHALVHSVTPTSQLDTQSPATTCHSARQVQLPWCGRGRVKTELSQPGRRQKNCWAPQRGAGLSRSSAFPQRPKGLMMDHHWSLPLWLLIWETLCKSYGDFIYETGMQILTWWSWFEGQIWKCREVTMHRYLIKAQCMVVIIAIRGVQRRG